MRWGAAQKKLGTFLDIIQIILEEYIFKKKLSGY